MWNSLKYGIILPEQPGNHGNAFNVPSVALSVILLRPSQMDGYSMMLLFSLCLPSTDVKTQPVHGHLELSLTKRRAQRTWPSGVPPDVRNCC